MVIFNLQWLDDDQDAVKKAQQKFIDPSVKNVSLYDRLGGDFTVDVLVAIFVERISGDKQLKQKIQQGGRLKVITWIDIKQSLPAITAYVKEAFGHKS